MAIPSPEFKERFDAKLSSVFGENRPNVIYTHDWSKDERYGTKFGGRVLSEILKIQPLK